jgi:glutamate N-acetyltransferase/amino-acid N-acetyltransferase
MARGDTVGHVSADRSDDSMPIRAADNLHLLSPQGFRAAGVRAGLKTKRGALDVGLLVCDMIETATTAAVFTTNQVFAAPVQIAGEHLKQTAGRAFAVVVNAGNANACTGSRGLRDAREMCTLAARGVGGGLRPEQVLPSSTGIIGHALPMPKLRRGIAAAAASLGSTPRHARDFADAILTTDTKRKTAALRLKIGRQTVTIAGVCKGSGMIGPRMSADAPAPASAVAPPLASARSGTARSGGIRPLHATMLAYITTDAICPVPLLRNLLSGAADKSFNTVTVDDHTSTNDTAVILASGASGASVERPQDIDRFAAALDEVCQSLAYQIAADGEGATTGDTVRVAGALTNCDAQVFARAIANTPLVKCARHGNDPNWGRIVSAAGLTAVPFDPSRATLRLQGTPVFRRGRPLKFNPARVSKSLDAAEVSVDLDCALGDGAATVWTCDLSKQYVTINADYHT